LRQADVLLGQGKKVEAVCRELKISDATYCKWRQLVNAIRNEDKDKILVFQIPSFFKMAKAA